ncbi:MAG: hypothetical protein BWX84_01229 [Verrucomicrobia bacterium ADurb.Bin118]|nr:MAG: hypothetical protein BWX84_01229 [Verrucomicrobia bacterium ADurb.Bin118]
MPANQVGHLRVVPHLLSQDFPLRRNLPSGEGLYK